MNAIDENIILIIKYLKISGVIRFKADAAKSMGISKQQLSNIENTDRSFTSEQIQKFCQAYDLNANAVLGLSEHVFMNEDEITITAIKKHLEKHGDKPVQTTTQNDNPKDKKHQKSN